MRFSLGPLSGVELPVLLELGHESGLSAECRNGSIAISAQSALAHVSNVGLVINS